MLAAQEARLTTPVDYFSVPIDFEQRFAGFDARRRSAPARPAWQMVDPRARWPTGGSTRGGANGTPVHRAQTVRTCPATATT